MALDKLVDSVKLDAALNYEANRILAKTGGSEPITFDFENAKGFGDIIDTISLVVPSGGDPNENLIKRATNTLTSVDIDIDNTTLAGNAFRSCTSLITAKVMRAAGAGSEVFRDCSNLETVVFANTPGSNYNINVYCFRDCAKLKTADFSGIAQITGGCFYNDPLFDTLILRNNTIAALGIVNVFYNTKFASGGAGGTIYIPKSMYDHLGDNSANDYKAASNWSVVNGYGTITWAKIEGSYYETHYADGTVISTT